MFVFDETVVDIKDKRVISKIKRQVINEVSKEIVLVWNALNLPVQSELCVQRKVVRLVKELDEIKQNRHQLNRSGIDVILGKYNVPFDISLKEVANNVDSNNDVPIIANDAPETAMDTGDEELPTKRATKRPAKFEDFYNDPGAYLEALSLADQDEDDQEWTPEEIDAISEPDYDKFKFFIELSERFNWSSYQTALGINALLLGQGITNQFVTQGKVLRMKIMFGREKIAAHKAKGPMLGIQTDAKKCEEALPNCRSHTVQMMTSVRLPENDYADHWVSQKDTGEEVGKGTIKVLKDTNSKDHALVTGSDGAANNTSPDTGSHKHIEGKILYFKIIIPLIVP